MKFETKCQHNVGYAFAFVNLLVFIIFYGEAQGMDAQYQLSWIPLSFIDFPVTIIFFLLMSLGVLPNVSAFVAFGIMGTLWWYLLAKFIASKFCRSE